MSWRVRDPIAEENFSSPLGLACTVRLSCAGATFSRALFSGLLAAHEREVFRSNAVRIPAAESNPDIVLFTRISMDVERNRGFWSKPKRRLGEWLRNFGFFDFAAMVLRYTLRMSWYPEERWLGGTIPVIFHCVLATYVVLVGVYLLRSDPAPSSGPRLS